MSPETFFAVTRAWAESLVQSMPEDKRELAIEEIVLRVGDGWKQGREQERRMARARPRVS